MNTEKTALPKMRPASAGAVPTFIKLPRVDTGCKDDSFPSLAHNKVTPTSVSGALSPAISTSKSLATLLTEPSMAGNTNTLFQPPTPQRYQPCALIIADDEYTKLKFVRQALRMTAKARKLSDLQPSPLNDIRNENAWKAQAKIIETIDHLTIIYVANGFLASEAITTLPNTIKAILITDQNMPEKSGTTLIAEMMAIQSIPIAIHTSDTQEDLLIAASLRQHPSLSYISKCNISEIANFIEQHCFKEFLEASQEESPVIKASSTSV